MTDTPTRTPRKRRPDGSFAPRLSAEVIVEAALALASREGGAALTVRRLGRELEADPAALYRFFRSKDDLLLMLADHMLAEVSQDMPAEIGWQDRLMRGGTRTVEVFCKYAAVGAMIASRTTRRENEIAIVDNLLGAMRSAGLSDEDAVLCYRTYADFILAYAGTRAQYVLLDEEARKADEEGWDEVYRQLSPEDYPHIGDLGEHLVAVEDDDVLRTGLQMIIDGIALKAARTRSADA